MNNCFKSQDLFIRISTSVIDDRSRKDKILFLNKKDAVELNLICEVQTY